MLRKMASSFLSIILLLLLFQGNNDLAYAKDSTKDVSNSKSKGSKFTLSTKNLNMRERGESQRVTAYLIQSNGTKKEVTSEVGWKVSDNSVIGVKNGEIVAYEEGRAVVTAMYGKSTATLNVSVNFNSDIEWQGYFGGSNYDEGQSIFPTEEGGYIVAGTIEDNSGKTDSYIAKITSLGELEWEIPIVKKGSEKTGSIRPTSDGGYIQGSSLSQKSKSTVYVMKLNKTGKKAWEKSFQVNDRDAKVYVEPTMDGGYILAADKEIFKLNKSGKTEWKTPIEDGAWSVRQTKDGEYLVGGDRLTRVDKSGKIEWSKPIEGGGYVFEISPDGGALTGSGSLVFKYDEMGELEWTKTINDGYSTNFLSQSIKQTSDGGYIIGGNAYLRDKNLQVMKLIKINETGDVEWEKHIGLDEQEYLTEVQPTNNGDFIAVGRVDFDYNNRSDIYVVKVSSNNEENRIKEFTLPEKYVFLKPGESYELESKVTYQNGKERDVSKNTKWTASEYGPVELSGRKITSRYEGNSVVEGDYQGYKARLQVIISNSRLQSIETDRSVLTLEKGDPQYIELTALFDDGTKRDISEVIEWTTSNEKVAVAFRESGYYGGKTIKINVFVK